MYVKKFIFIITFESPNGSMYVPPNKDMKQRHTFSINLNV